MNPWVALGAVAALAGAFGSGAYTHKRWADGEAAKAAILASEQARKDERDNAVSAIRRMDSYSVTVAENQRRALPARSDLVSVQHSLASIAAEAPASACGADDRLARVADLFGESASFLEEGARHLEELRATRDALRP